MPRVLVTNPDRAAARAAGTLLIEPCWACAVKARLALTEGGAKPYAVVPGCHSGGATAPTCPVMRP